MIHLYNTAAADAAMVRSNRLEGSVRYTVLHCTNMSVCVCVVVVLSENVRTTWS
jgi:hypothetical protein